MVAVVCFLLNYTGLGEDAGNRQAVDANDVRSGELFLSFTAQPAYDLQPRPRGSKGHRAAIAQAINHDIGEVQPLGGKINPRPVDRRKRSDYRVPTSTGTCHSGQYPQLTI